VLTSIDEQDVSGINGIEWDAVETASQFNGKFCRTLTRLSLARCDSLLLLRWTNLIAPRRFIRFSTLQSIGAIISQRCWG
jgi:hypothetical protein